MACAPGCSDDNEIISPRASYMGTGFQTLLRNNFIAIAASTFASMLILMRTLRADAQGLIGGSESRHHDAVPVPTASVDLTTVISALPPQIGQFALLLAVILLLVFYRQL